MAGLSLIDTAFLLAESADSPKHVSGLQIFRKPPGAKTDYLARLRSQLLERSACPPFDQVPHFPLLGFPQWQRHRGFCLGDHVFTHKLGGSASRRQLLRLVTTLHATMMVRTRPMWECHMVDGLVGGRFAVFFKIHHAYADGMTVASWLSRPLASHSGPRIDAAYWECPTSHPGNSDRAGIRELIGGASSALYREVAALPGAAQMAALQGLKLLGLGERGAAAPFTAPRTPLNTRLSPARKVCLLKFPLSRLRAIARAASVTVNDTVLALCDEALSEYLRARGSLPQEPLVAQVPMSLRKPGEEGGGNLVTLLLVELGGVAEGPMQRLLAISRHCNTAKAEARALSPRSLNTYLMSLSGIVLLAEYLGLGDRMPPVGNVLVSNVPGPGGPLYLGDALLQEAYPVSTLMPSLALNITVHTYHRNMFIGLVAAADILPDIDALGRGMRRSLNRLEQASRGVSP